MEQVQSLARELVHAMDVAKKNTKKQKHFAKLKSDHTIQFIITIKSY